MPESLAKPHVESASGFEPVTPEISFPELEKRCLELWRTQNIFSRSIELRKTGPAFAFYEGPPTANGMPHPGHVLTRIVKDLFCRYKTMQGFHAPRRAGWDTHGLPVEVEVEKTLGIHGRLDIEKYGVEAFTRRCVESVFKYIEEWRRMSERIGFWVDLDAAYVTYHQSYVQSVWWALSELYKKNLLYQDYKVVWWWPQGGTALSAGEVGQGYRTVDDPSVFVRFKVQGQANTSLLAWTTTPWTLPSNVALAVKEKETYCTVELEDGEKLILARSRLKEVLNKHPHKVIAEQTGKKLIGLHYTPVFDVPTPEGGKAYQVITADFVTLDSGTGIVHLAPAFGEDDFRVAKEAGLGFLQLVKPDGTFVDEFKPFAGRYCKEADRDLIRDLRARGLLFHEEVYRHEYPFCWRADQDPLIQYARRSWFIRTTKLNKEMLANNDKIHWEPEHIKEGRFGEFLRSNVDWALSRERYWGTPLPIWVNDETGKADVVSSVSEILARNPQAFDAFEAAQKSDATLVDDLRVHKPWIDQVTWRKEGEPGVYRRVPEVIDGWFDSGCMPFAQWGYPHQNKKAFEQFFPADFITEAVDQTRGWFYSLLAVSTMLFEKQKLPHPFKHCVVLGIIGDEKGQKLSKSKKNYTDPMDMIQTFGADAMRWSLYISSVPGQATRFFPGAAQEAVREFLLKLWNVYSFFVTYARIDHWHPHKALSEHQLSELDRWLLAEFDDVVRDVTKSMDGYRSHPAARRIAEFVDALSNWYVRRSRSRFWAEGDVADKQAGFATLHHVLVEFAKLCAPFTPFVSEAIYQNLVVQHDKQAPASVHLVDFPAAKVTKKDESLRVGVNAIRDIVTLGQQVRAQSKLKVRQPLSEAIVVVTSDEDIKAVEHFGGAIREELNIHNVITTNEPERYVDFTLLPNFRRLGTKLGPKMPALKSALAKANGLELYKSLGEKGSVEVIVDGEPIKLENDDVEVRLQAKSGFAAAAQGARVVVLDTTVTPELKFECYAREAINRIQRQRKELKLAYESRIEITYQAEGELAEALAKHKEIIAGETLAKHFEPSKDTLPPSANATDIEGLPFAFEIKPS